MNEMVERVARAIAIASDAETEARARIGQEPFISDRHRKLAIAAIGAMRATKQMVWAAEWWSDHCSDKDTMFDQMISAALHPEDVPPYRYHTAD